MAYQGQYDGLCGMYAVANAFAIFGVDGEEVFIQACRALPGWKWPDGVWKGTGLGNLTTMINHCREYFQDKAAVTANYPFSKKPPRTKKQYISRLQQLFSEKEILCAIVGTKDHWFTIKKENPESKRFIVVDSAHSLDEEFRVNSPYLQNLELDFKSLIIFRKA